MMDGGRLVAKALKKEGVEVIFTLCGGHVMAIYNGCLDEGIRVVDVRHEQAAVHAADAWARTTRKPGVAVVTAGPGVTDAVTGVTNAFQAESPVLIIGGQAPLGQMERGALQEMDHVALMRPITRWSRSAHDTKRIPEYVSIAFREALGVPQGPVFLEIPVDVLFSQAEDGEVAFPEGYRTTALTLGDPAYVSRALDLLEHARKPVAMAGGSVWWSGAWAELAEFADRAHIPVYLNGMGRGCLPPDHPSLFSLTRKYALGNADVVLVIGTPLDFRLGFGRPPAFTENVRIIQVDADRAVVGKNRTIDVGIVGDTQAVLRQMIGGLNSPGERREWFSDLRGREREAQEALEPLLRSTQVPIHPYRFLKEIRDVVDRDTIIVGGGGNIVGNAGKILVPSGPGRWLDTGRFGCLGVGPSFGLAAKLAHPEKKVLIVEGDGSFGFNGMEFDTMVRHGIPVVMAVGNDGSWNQIREPQLSVYGKERAVATALNFTRYDRVVEALGGYGEYVERPEEIRPALERALASGRPACVNVKIDASENRGSYGGMGL